MSRLHVGLAAHAYDILIEPGATKRLGALVAGVWSPRKVMVVSDTNVAPLYLEATTQSLEQAGFTVATTVIKAGEASKTLDGAKQVYSALIAAGFSRSDAVLTLGGGVVGIWPALSPRRSCAACLTSRYRPACWPRWIPASVAKPRWILAPART